ncbi:MAG TPA: hypothetical protein VML55_04480, partial [Planctomycetaceae bacterium]|nr:hypothetical protein [Planctomycetaceae bacterium]
MARILAAAVLASLWAAWDATPASAQGRDFRFSPEQIFGRRDGDRDRGGRGERDRDGDRSSSRSSTPGTRPGPRLRERVTLELAEKYTEGDLDGDGQIALHEWIQWKSRSAIGEFLALDLNQDGLLTPYELHVAEKNGGGNGAAATAGTSGGTRTSGTTIAGRTVPGGAAPAGGSRARLDEATEQIAREAFKNLAGEDGVISEEEWQRSRAARSRFEQAGVELKTPASLDTFLSLYPPDEPSTVEPASAGETRPTGGGFGREGGGFGRDGGGGG